jgi:hypothetical protein
MSYRDELKDLAKKIEYAGKDLDNYARAVDSLAEKIRGLEEENARLKAGK